jgi:uncharacterized membrane protein YhaH (DUF805 family)
MPPDILLEVGYDRTTFVRNAISEVKDTLIIAIILVVVIIFLFFREWKIALRPLIDIPVSLIGGFFIMYIMGFSINVLTLLAIVLATGLVVDDGIVVTENIFKKMEQGMNKYKAALEGSKGNLLCRHRHFYHAGYCILTHYFPGRICWKVIPRVWDRVGWRCIDIRICIAYPDTGIEYLFDTSIRA